MRCAIYIRRSTEEHQAESLETQLASARAFVVEMGWTEAAVFSDDGISRGEFKKRSGVIALVNAAARHELDHVVTRDETRLGGDMIRTTVLLQEITDHGVGIWYYATKKQVRLTDASSRFFEMARNYASELEREKVSERTRENLESKARRGLVAGGVVYGYRNERTPAGVRRLPHPEEAPILVEIFERRARGESYRTIVRWLNEEGVPPPRSGPHGWGMSCIIAILRRSLYVGIVEWGRVHKVFRHGTKVRVERPDREIVRVEIPELQLVSRETWERVQAKSPTRGKQVHRGAEPRYLLTGFSRCAECGGPIFAERQKRSYANVPSYLCGYHRDRGTPICPNALRRPVIDVDRALLAWFRAEVLTENVLDAVLVRVRERVEAAANPITGELARLETATARLRAELARLVHAIGLGRGAVEVLVEEVQRKETELARLDQRRKLLAQQGNVRALAGRQAEQRARARLANLGELLGANVPAGRKVLQALLVGPLRWRATRTTEGARYEITGEATIGRLVLLENTDRDDRRGVQEASPAGLELFPTLPIAVNG